MIDSTQTQTLQVREARERDLPAIARIAEVAFREAYREILSPDQRAFDLQRAYSPEALTQQLQDEGHRFLILLKDEQPVGFASCSPSETSADRLYLHKLYLLPNLKGLGYGRLLIDRVLWIARKEGFQALELTVNRRNPAVGFYRKLGFRIEKEIDLCIGRNDQGQDYWRNDYLMVRPLETPAG